MCLGSVWFRLTHYFSGVLYISVIVSTCTVMTCYGYSSIRPFNWTTVLASVDKNSERITWLTEVCLTQLVRWRWLLSADYYWTFFWLTYYVTYQIGDKLVRKQVACGPVKTWITFQYCTVHTNSTFYFIWDLLFFSLTFLYEFMLFNFRVEYHYMQNAEASPGLIEAYTCRRKSTPNCII